MRKLTVLLLSFIILCFAGCRGTAPAESPVPPVSVIESSVSETPLPPTTEEAAENNGAINPSDVRLIQLEEKEPDDIIALITTTQGEIVVRLFEKEAPRTVKAFTELADAGFYDGKSFAQIVDGYKIEYSGGEAGGVFPVENEFSLNLWNFRGAVSLTGNGADFMIVQAPQCLSAESELQELRFPPKVIEYYMDNGGAPHQDWENTVFGHVISGMEVVDKIAADGVPPEETPETSAAITEIKIIRP